MTLTRIVVHRGVYYPEEGYWQRRPSAPAWAQLAVAPWLFWLASMAVVSDVVAAWSRPSQAH